MKLHDESTTVVFLISSATSVDGGDGGEALHMFAVRCPGCKGGEGKKKFFSPQVSYLL